MLYERKLKFIGAITKSYYWNTSDGGDKPLYDYEKIIFESLVTHVGNTSYSKHLWMKKATGLGISEFMLRCSNRAK